MWEFILLLTLVRTLILMDYLFSSKNVGPQVRPEAAAVRESSCSFNAASLLLLCTLSGELMSAKLTAPALALEHSRCSKITHRAGRSGTCCHPSTPVRDVGETRVETCVGYTVTCCLHKQTKVTN